MPDAADRTRLAGAFHALRVVGRRCAGAARRPGRSPALPVSARPPGRGPRRCRARRSLAPPGFAPAGTQPGLTRLCRAAPSSARSATVRPPESGSGIGHRASGIRTRPMTQSCKSHRRTAARPAPSAPQPLPRSRGTLADLDLGHAWTAVSMPQKNACTPWTWRGTYIINCTSLRGVTSGECSDTTQP
jgi:hypothetical protein